MGYKPRIGADIFAKNKKAAPRQQPSCFLRNVLPSAIAKKRKNGRSLKSGLILTGPGNGLEPVDSSARDRCMQRDGVSDTLVRNGIGGVKAVIFLVTVDVQNRNKDIRP